MSGFVCFFFKMIFSYFYPSLFWVLFCCFFCLPFVKLPPYDFFQFNPLPIFLSMNSLSNCKYFSISHVWCFNLSNLVLILLIAIYFIYDLFFSNFILSMFFPVKFYPYFFMLFFFLLQVFLIDIFSPISLFKIKFAENWASWLSLSPKFHGLWVLEIKLGLEGSSRFVCFFFFLSWCFLIFCLLFSYFFVILFNGVSPQQFFFQSHSLPFLNL